MNNNLDIFHAYDVRGLVPGEISDDVVYSIARVFFDTVEGDRFAIGYDMRESSPRFFKVFVQAARDAGKTLVSAGMTTTDVVYYAVGADEYDGGVMITASHNPKMYNGIKLLRKGVFPMNMDELRDKYAQSSYEYIPEDGISIEEKDYSAAYISYMKELVSPDSINRFKVVVDGGNGMAGPLVTKLLEEYPAVELVPMNFEPNAEFPHHQANPSLEINTKQLQEAVKAEGADLGLAFDGDGDRCVFVDEKGTYIEGFDMVALLSSIVMKKKQGAKIVYEYRNIYAIEEEIKNGGGTGILSQAGHSNFKAIMKDQDADFGGESSSHFYFRETYNADNGQYPYLLILQEMSESGQSLSQLLKRYENFHNSGEHNFRLKDGVTVDEVYKHLQENLHNGTASYPDGLVMEFDSWRFNARPSNTEPILRINVEATTENQLQESVLDLHEIMLQFGEYISNPAARTEFDAKADPEEKFFELLSNLWFTWNPHYIMPILDLYGDGWRKNKPPVEFCSHYGKRKLEETLEEREWLIDQNLRLFRDYMADPSTWFDGFIADDTNKAFRKLKDNPIAYFCLEYGLVDWLQIYSGGLGVLAGDFIKEASDMGVPMVAVGIFYHMGYFHQDFDETGYQQETYIEQFAHEYQMELVKDKQGNPIEVSIEIVDHEVWVRAWKLPVGRTDLLLLDTNFDRNEREEDRMITAHLYGGDQDTRVRQEITLGIGGRRILAAMEVEPSLFHMNEGHSGFLVLEQARRYIEDEGMSFEDAMKKVKDHLVFTNHTLKQAGNDIFNYQLMEKFFGTYLDNLHTDMDTVYNLAKDDVYAQGGFSMTILGLKNAKISNAVSILHGKAAKRIWPDYDLAAVTNGVHMPTWVSPEIHTLLDKYVGENWHYNEYDVDYSKVQNIPNEELWEAHQIRKNKLIYSLNNELGLQLDPEALTLAWSRRMASYKRPDMLVSDLDRMQKIVNESDRPVQILIAGKAHPKDGIGKEMVQKINQSVSTDVFENKIVIVPGYNWQLARRIISGADVWVNTPYRFEEASGTSGMKACANGVLQLTTKDGWTDEVDWYKQGWVISEEEPSKSLHDTLEHQIVPLFFDIGVDGYSKYWVDMMKNTMAMSLENYSMTRMMKQYLESIYRPVLESE